MRSEQYRMAELYPLLQEVIDSGGEFRLYPRGTSMLPLIREGKDSVSLIAKSVPSRRDVCLYRRADGSFVLHRLIKWDKEHAPVFCGDNQTYFETGVPKESIIACVCAVYRGEKRVEITSLPYRLYVWFHCLMPWRKFFFFLRKTKRRIAYILKRK